MVATICCFFLSEIYKVSSFYLEKWNVQVQSPLGTWQERHRKLSYAVMEPETWPIMFTDKMARSRSLIAWNSHVQTLVQEWTNTNLIVSVQLMKRDLD